ncbi:EF-hand domain-containing protein [Qingshengfaniella alkalisoli]|uniref:Calcium sensor EFh n=1 Tax=Qingshengfaniella alkalisoli TaxID=2599296 RepID=A0A5B8IV57_9RHOB|nr:EF-hand domain-containing protein [Qingshengfaniella alkalisoli]QDY69494.1 calcium sensor EFh [Qingshengfaniella alkalisoli]
MTSVTRTIGFALATTLLGSMALAAPQDRAEMFERLDADGNGQITQADLDAARQERFDAIDTDGNGMLTADELVAHERLRADQRRIYRVERMIARMDQDGDGQINAVEMMSPERQQVPRGLIERMDTDGDGSVTHEEFADFAPRGMRPRGDEHGHKGRVGRFIDPAER